MRKDNQEAVSVILLALSTRRCGELVKAVGHLCGQSRTSIDIARLFSLANGRNKYL